MWKGKEVTELKIYNKLWWVQSSGENNIASVWLTALQQVLFYNDRYKSIRNPPTASFFKNCSKLWGANKLKLTEKNYN